MFGARRVARRTARRTTRRVARRRMPAPAPAPAPAGAPASQGTPAGTPATSYILLAGEGGSPPIKISQQDAQRIQEDTGLPPEQLEDNDLKESMQELNIQSVPLTPQDQAALGMQPSPPPQTPPGSTVVVRRPPPAPPAPPVNPQTSVEQQLESLQGMKDKGLISEDDYNAKKKQVLGI